MRILLLLLFAGTLQGQKIKVTGTVADGKDALGGVSITYPGGKSYSNANGRYEVDILPGNVLFHFEKKGFEPKTLEVGIIQNTHLDTLGLLPLNNSLSEVVITGQHAPQSIKNSVYRVRVIGPEQIQQRGATNLQSILSTELGMRFSNDLTLGTSDIELMGMSGQNVKILLDGIPLLDRGATRESLGQIDINNVEKIEIVEGPMSVNYGSDALAGVINIISKTQENYHVNARIQEETAGNAYRPLTGLGQHYASLSAGGKMGRWYINAGLTRNFFGGYQGKSTGRKMDWMPKEQYLTFAQLAYKHRKLDTWYRFNGTDETLKSLGNTYINRNTNHDAATDQYYLSKRLFHQLQASYRLAPSHQLHLAAAYTDYQRNTETTEIDLVTKRRTLAPSGNQDKAVNDHFFLRFSGLHTWGKAWSLQHGAEVNLTSASGERILGKPEINDYAYFFSLEYKPLKWLQLRPGVRFIRNSVYDAPPLIPSINTKFRLHADWDLRLAYSRGFRSPALRELYFTFFDASHAIRGNENLKAETSDSFNAFLTYQKNARYKITLGTFYNHFENLIAIGADPQNTSINTYLNIDKHKTTGATLSQTFHAKTLTLSLGLSHIGRYNGLSEGQDFLWSTELNTTVQYHLPKWGTHLNLFLKYTGKLPRYLAETVDGTTVGRLTELQAYTLGDLSIQQKVGKVCALTFGVKNLFDVKDLMNSNASTGSAHSTGSAVPLAYGRAYFLGLQAQIFK